MPDDATNTTLSQPHSFSSQPDIKLSFGKLNAGLEGGTIKFERFEFEDGFTVAEEVRLCKELSDELKDMLAGRGATTLHDQ